MTINKEQPVSDAIERLGRELRIITTPITSQRYSASSSHFMRNSAVLSDWPTDENETVMVRSGDLRTILASHPLEQQQAVSGDVVERVAVFPALVEGLHAQIFGVHSLGDPTLSHAALADGGVIHEVAHALLRALPPAPATYDVERLVKEALSIATYGSIAEVQVQIARNAVRTALTASGVERMLAGIAERATEGDGFWRACTGCQESVEGCVSIKDYPFDPMFQCQPGGGCRECGGIGVVWDNIDYADFARTALQGGE